MIKLHIGNADDANDGECFVSLHINIAAWYTYPKNDLQGLKKHLWYYYR